MRVVLEIIKQSAGDEIESKTKLFKAFYFAHLYYAAEATDYLTDWPIVKMPWGPGIDQFDTLLDCLIDAGVITAEKSRVGPYPSTTYRHTGEALPGDQLGEQAVDAIHKAVEFVSHKSGAQLSDITHEFSRSWRAADDGDELNIYADLLLDDEYEEYVARQRELQDDIMDAWKQ